MATWDNLIWFFVERPVRFHPIRLEHVVVAGASCALFGYLGNSRKYYKHISNAHCIPVSALSLLAINDVIPEWVTMIYSASYMLVDGLNMAIRLKSGTAFGNMSWFFATHHFAVLPLYLHPMICTERLYANNASSRLLLMELANPFLNRWEATKSYSDFLVAYTLMLGFRGVYCGWFSDFVRRTCGGVNALVALTHVLWAAQLGCWIIPQTPKLWNYEAEMAKEEAMDAEAQSAKQA